MAVEQPLSQIATITTGTSPKGDTYNQNGEGLPLLNGPTEFGSVHPNCTVFTTKSIRVGQVGDLIFCVRGSTTGRMNWADRVYSLGRGVCSIRGKSTSDTRFIKYCLDWKLESLLKLAGGGTFPNLTQDTIRSFEIPFPESRREIAAILSAYDDLIENNLRRIKILEEMAQNLYREWFVKFRFPGHQHARFTDSPLGRIPEGWEVKRVGDVAAIVMGQSPKSEFYNQTGEGLPFHQGVTDFGQHFPTDRVFCTVQNRIAEPGDILFSVRAPVGRINIANKRIVVGRGLCAIRNRTDSQSLLLCQLKERFKEEDSMGGGTIFKAVTKEDVHGIKTLCPDEHISKLFEEVGQPIVAELKLLTSKNANLRQTRHLLLPRLISGEVDVSELDIAVPEEDSKA